MQSTLSILALSVFSAFFGVQAASYSQINRRSYHSTPSYSHEQPKAYTPKVEAYHPKKVYTPKVKAYHPKKAYTPKAEAYHPKQAYTPKVEAYHPKKVYTSKVEAYHPKKVYAPKVEAYNPKKVYAPKVEVYQPKQEVYTPKVEAYQPKQVYTPKVEAYQPKQEVYTPKVEAYQPKQEVYKPEPVKASYSPKPYVAKKPAYVKANSPDTIFVTKVTVSKPRVGIEPAPSHQVGLVGGGDLPTLGFSLFEANPGVGTIPALVVVEGPALGPKSYAQALVVIWGPQLGTPFLIKFFGLKRACQASPKMVIKLGKAKTPEAKPARTNGHPSQDGPSKSQITVPETPKNDHEAANQTAEPEMPSLDTQIALEECPEAPACDQTPVDKTKAFNYYHPPNASFDPVHFTEYPANPDHKPWTLEDLQWYTRPNALKEPYQIVCDSKAITIYPLIFSRKYNNPAAYLVPMELPPTPKPTISTPPTSDATGHSIQFLGVLYLVLTGLINSALLAAGPWAVAGKALSYLVKLGPIIWWDMTVPALTPPSPSGTSQYSWYPDNFS
ncbi:hypothetical protein DSO57_1010232 [Entomophthora muscae]|uniref:Uncharacterized protein n=1 Tax=Entomophthora muscae TaxID=34485 RepID=A0ACC2RXT1_9FUNG|nr:hypothetical protein DSO57_1010232 [Entomophthora muscae]